MIILWSPFEHIQTACFVWPTVKNTKMVSISIIENQQIRSCIAGGFAPGDPQEVNLAMCTDLQTQMRADLSASGYMLQWWLTAVESSWALWGIQCGSGRNTGKRMCQWQHKTLPPSRTFNNIASLLYTVFSGITAFKTWREIIIKRRENYNGLQTSWVLLQRQW